MDRMYFKPNDKPNLTEMWEEASQKASKKGVMVEVTIRPQRKTRTTGERSQNRHLNGHIQQICEETGNTFDVVKDYVKQQAIAMGYPIKKNLKGNYVINPYGYPVGISETESSTKECGYLIDAVHILAGELGITLKESEDESN